MEEQGWDEEPMGWELVGEKDRAQIALEGIAGGICGWENASDVDKNRRKECGRKGGWELVSEAGREQIA